MKRLDIVREQIKNNSNIYTGKSAYEHIILENKDQVFDWFDSLIPIQQQIDMLIELGCENLQKRNYVRIITKLFPEEYNQFVSLNILIRDVDAIASVFSMEDEEVQYYDLVNKNKLKFPGRHKKYVSIDIYREFIKVYEDDLRAKMPETTTTYVTKQPKPVEVVKEDEPIAESTPHETEASVDTSNESKKDEKKTDWLKLLTG